MPHFYFKSTSSLIQSTGADEKKPKQAEFVGTLIASDG